MAVYSFDTMSSADALAMNRDIPNRDTLIFTTPGSSAGEIEVAFKFSSNAVSVTSDVTGRTLSFGPNALQGQTITFPDGTRAFIGRGTGGPENDAYFGHDYHDTFAGGDGADTIVESGAHPSGFVLDDESTSQFSGGPGADLFVFQPGASPAASPGGSFHIHRATVSDWEPVDHISFGNLTVTAANYVEIIPSSPEAGFAAANALISSGQADVVVAQETFGVVTVYVDSNQDNGIADDAVDLRGSLSDVGLSNFVTAHVPAYAAPTIAATPPAPPTWAPGAGVTGSLQGDIDSAHLSELIGAPITNDSPTELHIDVGTRGFADVVGTGLTYDANDQLTGGSVSHLYYQDLHPPAGPGFYANLAIQNLSAASFSTWVNTDATTTAFSTILAGPDQLGGDTTSDLIRGYGGNDLLSGHGGADTIYGGDGDDQIFTFLAPGEPVYSGYNGYPIPGSTYLRGEAGDDYVQGGNFFDDINGNQGNDTEAGGSGGDWVVGGQGNDLVFGQADDDIVYGNLGNDTCNGGEGADLVRGGQGDDSLTGEADDDWLSGDLGSDTLTGGAGADTFHTFATAGLDRVTDFNAAEGDRVQVDQGATYTVVQQGLDTVVDFGGGNEMVLVGVQLSALPAGWIFSAPA